MLKALNKKEEKKFIEAYSFRLYSRTPIRTINMFGWEKAKSIVSTKNTLNFLYEKEYSIEFMEIYEELARTILSLKNNINKDNVKLQQLYGEYLWKNKGTLSNIPNILFRKVMINNFNLKMPKIIEKVRNELIKIKITKKTSCKKIYKALRKSFCDVNLEEPFLNGNSEFYKTKKRM